MALVMPWSRELTIDRGAKRLAYGAAGVPSYWIVDPRPESPSLTVLTLGPDGGYDDAVVKGDEEWTDPGLGLTVTPARLVRPVRSAS